MEEDDKLRKIFSDFEPEVSSDLMFMTKLERSLESVEIVRRRSAEIRSRNRKAVAIAAVVGFIAGFLFSLLLPVLQRSVMVWRLSLPDTSWLTPIADNFMIIGWLAVACSAALIAMNAYDLSMSLLSKEKTL